MRDGDPVYCERFDIPIRARDKYGLSRWKEIRNGVLERDGQQCAICSGEEDLHVHHIDRDPTNDDPKNLITLCGICHARVHTELRRRGGAKRVSRMFSAESPWR